MLHESNRDLARSTILCTTVISWRCYNVGWSRPFWVAFFHAAMWDTRAALFQLVMRDTRAIIRWRCFIGYVLVVKNLLCERRHPMAFLIRWIIPGSMLRFLGVWRSLSGFFDMSWGVWLLRP